MKRRRFSGAALGGRGGHRLRHVARARRDAAVQDRAHHETRSIALLRGLFGVIVHTLGDKAKTPRGGPRRGRSRTPRQPRHLVPQGATLKDDITTEPPDEAKVRRPGFGSLGRHHLDEAIQKIARHIRLARPHVRRKNAKGQLCEAHSGIAMMAAAPIRTSSTFLQWKFITRSDSLPDSSGKV